MTVIINKNYSKKINKLTIWLLPWPSPCAGICDQNEDGYDGFHFSRFVKMIVLRQPHCVCILVI